MWEIIPNNLPPRPPDSRSNLSNKILPPNKFPMIPTNTISNNNHIKPFKKTPSSDTKTSTKNLCKIVIMMAKIPENGDLNKNERKILRTI